MKKEEENLEMACEEDFDSASVDLVSEKRDRSLDMDVDL